jgi:hypothetical protein
MDALDTALLILAIFGFLGGSIIFFVIIPRVDKANAKQTS